MYQSDKDSSSLSLLPTLPTLPAGCVGVTLRSTEYATVSAAVPSDKNPAEYNQLIF